MDNYRFYLTARVRIFKSFRQDLAGEKSNTFWVHHPVSTMETQMAAHLVTVSLSVMSSSLSIPAWSRAWLRRSRLIFHNFFRLFIFFPFILWRFILLALGWSTSPPRAGLLRLFISSITIKITAYLFSRELEVNLSRSDIYDRVGGVEERSSKDNGCSVFFFSHVQEHEIIRA